MLHVNTLLGEGTACQEPPTYFPIPLGQGFLHRADYSTATPQMWVYYYYFKVGKPKAKWPQGIHTTCLQPHRGASKLVCSPVNYIF